MTKEIPELRGRRNLRVSEVCTVLGLGRSKVYELFEDGRLRSLKIDGARRVSVAAVEEFLATCDPVERAEVTSC